MGQDSPQPKQPWGRPATATPTPGTLLFCYPSPTSPWLLSPPFFSRTVRAEFTALLRPLPSSAMKAVERVRKIAFCGKNMQEHARTCRMQECIVRHWHILRPAREDSFPPLFKGNGLRKEEEKRVARQKDDRLYVPPDFWHEHGPPATVRVKSESKECGELGADRPNFGGLKPGNFSVKKYVIRVT